MGVAEEEWIRARSFNFPRLSMGGRGGNVGKAMGEAMMVKAVRRRLLSWYDRHARELPWRVGPQARLRGERPDPYRVWLSEVMLQQTGVAVVGDYFRRFLVRWPDLAALARAEDAEVMGEWAGLGYYARARNLLNCARVVAAAHGGRFPDTEAALRELPGIGSYTAAAVAAIAFDRQATVIDGNVERVISRMFAVQTPLPAAKPEIRRLAEPLTPKRRAGDFAQAMMDLGATICTPRSPACGACPLGDGCMARAAGIAATLPRRAPRMPKPVRRGIVYVARRSDGAWLVETRPPKGLLGGTLGFPGSEWAVTGPAAQPPVAAKWRDAAAEVRHTFTHFHLILTVMVACTAPRAHPRQGAFIPAHDFLPGSLPSLMRKVLAIAGPVLERD